MQVLGIKPRRPPPPEHMLAFWAPFARVVLLLGQLEQAVVVPPVDHLP